MLKVLIADDEYLVCQFLKKMIDWEKMGMECVGEASNGIESFQLIQRLSPDIVIADIRMPGLSGLELIEKCSQSGIVCSFIIISGYPDFEYVKTAFTKGAANYILKPIDEIELENTLLEVRKRIEEGQQAPKQDRQPEELPESQLSTIHYAKQDVLRRLLAESEEMLSLEKVNQAYGCCFDETLAFNVAVSNISIQEGDREMHMVFSGINAKVEEQFRRHITPLCCECQVITDQEQLIFLLNYDPAMQAHLEKEICTVIEKLQRNMELINARITIGLGSGEGKSYARLHKEAIHALDCRYVDKRCVIVDGDVIYTKFNIYEILNPEWENRFLNLIDVGNEQDLKKLLEGVRQKIAERGQVDPHIYVQALKICASLFQQEAKRLFYEVFDERKYAKMIGSVCMHSRSIAELFRRLVMLTVEIYHECIEKVELKERWPVVKAKQYIEEHYSEKIVLKDLAGELFVNADYFSSVFKKDVGIGFNDYLRQYRMTIAQHLIRSGEYSLDQVAEKVGYMDPKHFSKSFKKTLGVSPAEYKKFYK